MHPYDHLDLDTRNLLREQAQRLAHQLRQQAMDEAAQAFWDGAQRATARLQARLRAHAKLRQRLVLG